MVPPIVPPEYINSEAMFERWLIKISWWRALEHIILPHSFIISPSVLVLSSSLLLHWTYRNKLFQ